VEKEVLFLCLKMENTKLELNADGKKFSRKGKNDNIKEVDNN
jgi:hypothetical protein